ncbi:unnamed protein product [Paramecium primaurelia]|uniref:Uncharacterized protein n=1 Tax=Paramecium primaurelia TaxID=5886 RepID=A0A8S1K1L2_PARPR|nr:unnamed protein product [Paramecium primaurelia]CAD8048704.1 unnamed protein product [Paramecium primaurelia]
MKPKKTFDLQRVTELGENILKAQKLINQNKHIQEMKSISTIQNIYKLNKKSQYTIENYVISFLEEFESLWLIMKKQLKKRLSKMIYKKKPLNAYVVIIKLTQSINENQKQSLQIHQLQEQVQEVQEEYTKFNKIQQHDYIKQLIDQHSEEKSQLLNQIEELKLQQKLVQESFFQTTLFVDLVQQNNYLTFTLFNVEDQLVQGQLMNNEQQEKFQIQIQQLQSECEQKVKDLMIQQEIIKIEIKQTDDQIQNKQVEQLQSQMENFSKVIEELKIELQQCRDRNIDINNNLLDAINQKQSLLSQNNELKQTLSVYKIMLTEEKIEQVTLRYENHKQILFQIEQESQKFIIIIGQQDY